MHEQSARVPCIFVTGPVRSGKSRFAERLARERGAPVLYVATARIDPADPEMAERLARHVARRPAEWQIVETARSGGPSLPELAAVTEADRTLLVDSLGTWLADRMSRALERAGESAALDPDALDADATAAADALASARAHVIVVGDETGWGVVPDYPSGRVFRDVLGRMQARLARRAQRAYLVVAGYALDLHAGVAVDPWVGTTDR